jgi:hypothetical protein
LTNKPAFRLIVILLCSAVLGNASKADAQTPVSGKQAAGIFAVLIGATAGIGVGVYLLVRAPRNITGCVSEVDGNLELTEEKAMNHYLLAGEIAAMKPSEQVRLAGKPGRGKNGKRTFFVKKLSRDYGSCKVDSALP